MQQKERTMDSIDHTVYQSDSDHLEWLRDKFIDPIPFHGRGEDKESLQMFKTKGNRHQQEKQFQGQFSNWKNNFSVGINHDVPLELEHPQPLYYHDNDIAPPPSLVTSTSMQYLGLPAISTTASIDHQVQQDNLGSEGNKMIQRNCQVHDSNGYHPSTTILQEKQNFSMNPSSSSSHHVCSSKESEDYPHSAEMDPFRAKVRAIPSSIHYFDATTSSNRDFSFDQPRCNVSSIMRETPTLRNADSIDLKDARDNGAQSTFVESNSTNELPQPTSYEVEATQYHQPWYFDHNRAWYHHPHSTFQEANASMTANQQFHPQQYQYQSYSSLPVESSRHVFPVHHISSDDHEYPSHQVQSSTSANYTQSTQKKRSFEEYSGVREVTDEKNPRRPISAYNFFFMEEKEVVVALLSSTNTLLHDDHSNDHDFSLIKELDADGLVRFLDKVSKNTDPDKLKDFQESIHKKTEDFLIVHFEEDRSKKPHKKRHGLVSFLDLARVIGKRWRMLSPEHKKRYHELASQDKKRFNEMANTSHQ